MASRLGMPQHGCMDACTHTQTDGQPENVMPPARSTGWMEAGV